MFENPNPLTIIFSAILVFTAVWFLSSKVLKRTSFGTKHKQFVTITTIMLCTLMATSSTFLKFIANILPIIGLIGVVMMIGTLIFLGLGASNTKIENAIKKITTNTYSLILIVLVIAWAISLSLGQELLETKSIKVTGSSIEKEINIDKLFDTKTLSIGMILIVLGTTFYFVTRGK